MLWTFRNKTILYASGNFRVGEGSNSDVWAFLSNFFQIPPLLYLWLDSYDVNNQWREGYLEFLVKDSLRDVNFFTVFLAGIEIAIFTSITL